MPSRTETLLSPAQALAFLGIAKSSLHALAHSGRLTIYHAPPELVRTRGTKQPALYALSELATLKEERQSTKRED